MRLIYFLILATLSFACNRWEVLDAAYSSREEVVRDGAIKRGWIPEWIPSSVSDVREVHDLDTNRSQLVFTYTDFDMAAVAPACRSADQQGIVFPRTAFRTWWPVELTVGSAAPAGFLLFSCPQEREPHAFFAVDPVRKRAYFWRESRG